MPIHFQGSLLSGKKRSLLIHHVYCVYSSCSTSVLAFHCLTFLHCDFLEERQHVLYVSLYPEKPTTVPHTLGTLLNIFEPISSFVL